MKIKKNLFLIVGVSKCGTTSLSSYLSQHENIYLPKDINEPRFFVNKTIKNISELDPLKSSIIRSSRLNIKCYNEIFKVNGNTIYCCEDSIHYFNHPEESINNIKNFLGDIPIFIIIRNPVDRMISNWKYIKNDLLPFNLSLKYEQHRLSMGYNSFWGYQNQSFYYEKIKLFMKNFTKVKILLFEEFINDTNKILNDCLKFLELDPYDFDTNKVINKTGDNIYVDNKFLLQKLKGPYFFKYFSNFLINCKIDRLSFLFKSKSDLSIDKKMYYPTFKKDIRKVENILNRDLSIWKF